MKQKEILQRIRQIPGKENVEFPSQIVFSTIENSLIMHVKGNGVRDNMQTNGSAFEGWAIGILACFPNEIDHLILGWDKPRFSENQEERNRQEKHYNRFVLRAMLFEDVFNWVSIEKENKNEIKKVRSILPTLLINYPKSESKKKVAESEKVNKGEAKLERQLVEIMKETIQITDHQLPVGLFEDEVKKDNTFTPRGASQIDIWQLKDEAIRIFELKDKDNNQVGIISELMFYASTMRLLIQGVIKYPDSLNEEKKNYRHIQELYLAIKSLKLTHVEAYFLIYTFHPLIEDRIDEILSIINSGMAKVNVTFKKLFVNDILRK